NKNIKDKIISQIIRKYKDSIRTLDFGRPSFETIPEQIQSLYNIISLQRTKAGNRKYVINLLYFIIAKTTDKILIEYFKLLTHHFIVRTIRSELETIDRNSEFQRIYSAIRNTRNLGRVKPNNIPILRFETPQKLNLRTIINS